jgi:hypothetical protein
VLDIYAYYFRRKMSILFYCLSTGRRGFCLFGSIWSHRFYLSTCLCNVYAKEFNENHHNRAFASVAANQNLLCTISTMEKPQSLSNYLIILMQMRFRTKIGVQGSSQKKCKRKEKNQESHLNVPACIYKMTTLASFAAPPRRVVRLVSTSWCSNEWLKKSFTEFVYSEHICSQRILFSNWIPYSKDVAISRHWKVSLCETACRGEMQVQRDEGVDDVLVRDVVQI